jgi:hypothetical protein
MTDFAGIATAGATLQRFLQMSFNDRQPLDGDDTSVIVARTEDLDPANFSNLVSRPALTVHVYRVDLDPSVRTAWATAAVGGGRRRPALAVQMHFLITPWGANADEEHRIIGRAMQAIEETPILSGPLLAGEGWEPDETLQIVMEDMDTHALLRIFDSLPISYRLSTPYLARVLRLSGQPIDGPPVVTSVLGLRPSLEDASA